MDLSGRGFLTFDRAEHHARVWRPYERRVVEATKHEPGAPALCARDNQPHQAHPGNRNHPLITDTQIDLKRLQNPLWILAVAGGSVALKRVSCIVQCVSPKGSRCGAACARPRIRRRAWGGYGATHDRSRVTGADALDNRTVAQHASFTQNINI